ncbi:MAG: hypothetical protein KC468_09320, partial [Myxococcales bacterium]|nr:hypothetical protein [Myxococcales bacterium]
CDALQTAERAAARERERGDELRREQVTRYGAPGSDPNQLAQHELDRVFRRACVESFANTHRTSGAIEELLQVAAQVVVDRATQAGWRLLKDQLLRAANCDEDASAWRLRRTCEVLRRTNIQDVLSNPTALVNASIEDLFTLVPDVLGRPVGPRHEFIRRALAITDSASTAVRAGGLRGLESASERHAYNVLHYAADQATCSDPALTPGTRVARALVDCIVDGGGGERDILACDMERRLRVDCQLEPSLAREYTTLLDANPDVLKSDGLRDRVNVVFALARVDAAVAGDVQVRARDLEAARHLLVGLLDRDWTTATAAAGELLLARVAARQRSGPEGPRAAASAEPGACAPAAVPATTASPYTTSPPPAVGPTYTSSPPPRPRADREPCADGARTDDCRGARNLQKYFALLTAIGQYATTLARPEQGSSQAAPTAARTAIIEELIKRTVSRSARPHNSAVVSIGGSLGLGGSARLSARTGAYSGFVGPLYVGLGFAVDSYHRLGPRERWGGVHAELSFFELGQYLTFETTDSSGDLTIKTPQLAQAVSLGLKLGFWTALRETPLFVAPYVAFAPFSLNEDDDFTISIGGMLGIYIPFFDFN